MTHTGNDVAALRRRTGAIAALIAALPFCLAGCGNKEVQRTRMGGVTADGRVFPAEPNPVGRETSVRAELLSLGGVPYDNMTLPLISPDAQYVATEVGVAPQWSALLAEPFADLPTATRVDVYRIRRGSISGASIAEPVASRRGPVLLGRSVSRRGFLVEGPQPDGSRWIGMMSWATGDLEWLVTGPDVNSFATLGPGRRMAWSRRMVDGEHFELVVRHGNDEFVVPADGGDWLMPQWAGCGDGLFVLRLEQGRLMACHADAPDAATFDVSWQSLPLIDEATVFTAYQTMAGQSSIADVGAPEAQQLSLYHPGLRQAVLWRPFAVAGQRVVMFQGTAMVVTPVPGSPLALVTTPKDLLRQPIGSRSSVSVMSGVWMPRATPAAQWSFTLLTPDEGRVGMTALHLLPAE